jgi:hypothetical protein
VAAMLGAGSPDAIPALAYHIPRVAIDYAFPFHLTLGFGGGAFFGNSTTKSSDGTKGEGPGLLLFVLEPRVGYMIPLGSHMALWPRVGFSYFGFSQLTTSSATKQTTYASVNGMAVDVEPTFVFRPGKYTGITASVLADIGVFGRQNPPPAGTTTDTESVLATNFGLTFGAYVGF